MVRQELLDRLFDQVLHRNAAQNGGNLELAVFCFGNTGAELRLSLSAASGQVGVGRNPRAVQPWIRTGFLGGGGADNLPV
jgi:hypothetical protein